MGSMTTLPYWQVNVPEKDRTEECPEWLQALSKKDISILSTPDSEYHTSTWEEVQQCVAANRLDLFQRIPSELRRYRRFLWELNREHGSVMNFIMKERVRWEEPIVAKGKPFQLDEDMKVLYNDWPYGIDPRIVHLVVWTKFDLEEDPATGDLTDTIRGAIDEYVEETFRSRVPGDRVIWFKNWRGLRSVRALEHFHVMLFEPDADFVNDVTKGDRPFSQKTSA